MSKEWFVFGWTGQNNEVSLRRCKTNADKLPEAWYEMDERCAGFLGSFMLHREAFETLCKAIDHVRAEVKAEEGSADG